MTDEQQAENEKWFKWCFQWWTPYVGFALSNESRSVDVTQYIPPKGWVT